MANMINIKIAGSQFASGGLFETTPESRACIILGGGRNDIYIGKSATQPYPITNDSYAGGQAQFIVTSAGLEMHPYQFEYLMKNLYYQPLYASQLLELQMRGVLEVRADGVLLTANQIRNFTA
jgi:hypothetical protein